MKLIAQTFRLSSLTAAFLALVAVCMVALAAAAPPPSKLSIRDHALGARGAAVKVGDLIGNGGPASPDKRSEQPRAPRTKDEARVPGRYIVVFKDSVEYPGNLAEAQAEQRNADLGFVYRDAIKGYSAKLSKGAVEALREDPRVKYVVADQKVEAFAQTIPTGIKRVYATENATADIDGTDDARVNVDVAVIDTGVDYTHPDLNVVARTYCNAPQTEEEEFFGEEPKAPATCVDNTGTDAVGHGTHVAGTIGAIDNGLGVVGVAPGARIWSVKVLDPGGWESELVAGVEWVKARAATIEVANMSLGCYYPCTQPVLEEAIEKTTEAGVVFAVAAGNEGMSAGFASPAQSPDVITVSALADYDGKAGESAEPLLGGEGGCETVDHEANYGEDDALAWFSNRGDDVEVAAPGVCILSTVPGGGYGFNSGTSMAAPHVAGAAALLASKSNPNNKAAVEAIGQQIEDEGSQRWTDRYLWNGTELAGGGFFGWEPDGIQEPLLDVGPQAAATYTTRPLDVGPGSALLNGGANPNATATSYQFEYGTTVSYGSKVPASAKSIGSGKVDVKAGDTASGLKPKTTYHFRLATTAGAKTTYGEDRTFTTTAAVLTSEATEIDAHRARLEGRVNPIGSETSYWFEYGTTTGYGGKAPASPKGIGSGTAFVDVGEEVGELLAEQTYHFRLVASNAKGETHYGEDRAFTTSSSSFVLDKDEGSLAGEGIEGLFLESHTVSGQYLSCDVPSFTASLQARQSESASIEVEAPLCTQQYLAPEENYLQMNECQFKLHPGVRADPNVAYGYHAGTIDIDCPVGKAIVLPSKSYCEITIGAQNGLFAWYRNTFEGSIELVVDDLGVKHTQASTTGFCQAGTFEDGRLGGRWIVYGKNAAGGSANVNLRDIHHAARFEATGYPFTLAATGPATLTLDTFAIDCTSSSLEGPLSGLSTKLVLDVQQSGCTAGGPKLPTVVAMNGCHYTLRVLSGPPYAGRLGVDCEAGKEITYTVYTSSEMKTVACTVKVWDQSQHDGVALSPVVVGSGVKWEENVKIDAQVAGVEYERSGSTCAKATRSDGVIDFEATLSDKAQQQVLYIEGSTQSVDPVAAYSFNAGSGSTLTDSAANHDGTIEGATWTASGKYGSALDFDGNDRVTIPDAGDLDLTDSFTLEAWVSPDTYAAGRPVISKGELSGPVGYMLTGEVNGKPQGLIANTTTKSVTGPTALSKGTWSHVAVTSDGTTLRLYVGGQLKATAPSVVLKGTGGVLEIGHSVFSGYFDGRIDEVRIYDETLSQGQIEADRDTPVEPIAAYSFNEGSGSTLNDSVANHDGTVSGATWTAEGRYGQALDFDGTNDVVTIADANDLDLTGSFTIEAWVRPDVLSGWRPVVHKGETGPSGYVLSANSDLSKPQGTVANAGTVKSVSGPSALHSGIWTHLALSSNGTTLSLYVGGELVETAPAVAAKATAGVLKLGYSGFYGAYFDGLIDEVRIYDTALSQSQIETDRDEGV
jgi:subtilisin family serine protease